MGSIASKYIFVGQRPQEIHPSNYLNDETFSPVLNHAGYITLTTSEGLEFPCIFVKNQFDKLVIVYSHSNASRLDRELTIFTELMNRNLQYCSILVYEYPGYGMAQGRPSLNNCYDSLCTVIEFIISQGFEVENIILFGRSLGTNISVFCAQLYNNIGGLILEGAFTGLVDTQFNMRCCCKYANTIDIIPQLKMPILYIHGTLDDIVDINLLHKLISATNNLFPPFILEGYGHNNIPFGDDKPRHRTFCYINCCCQLERKPNIVVEYFSHMSRYISSILETMQSKPKPESNNIKQINNINNNINININSSEVSSVDDRNVLNPMSTRIYVKSEDFMIDKITKSEEL